MDLVAAGNAIGDQGQQQHQRQRAQTEGQSRPAAATAAPSPTRSAGNTLQPGETRGEQVGQQETDGEERLRLRIMTPHPWVGSAIPATGGIARNSTKPSNT